MITAHLTAAETQDSVRAELRTNFRQLSGCSLEASLAEESVVHHRIEHDGYLRSPRRSLEKDRMSLTCEGIASLKDDDVLFCKPFRDPSVFDSLISWVTWNMTGYDLSGPPFPKASIFVRVSGVDGSVWCGVRV